MPNGYNKNRSQRVAAYVVKKTLITQIEEFLFDKNGPAKVLILFLTAAILCVIIEAWNPPFGFQIFHETDRDVVCTVPFEVEAPQKTNEAKQAVRFDTPHVYINDPSKLAQFKARLVNTVQSLLACADYASMTEEDQVRWKSFLPTDTTTDEAAAKFAQLQQTLEKDIELANFKASIDRVFRPYEKNGILIKLHDSREGNQETIQVYEIGTSPDSAREVPVRDVLIGNAYLIKDLLNLDFSREISDLLFQWIRPEIVETLTEDRDATAKNQHLAEEKIEPVFTCYEPGQILLKRNTPIDTETFNLLQKEYQVMISQRTVAEKLIRTGGIFFCLFIALVMSSFFMHTRRNRFNHQNTWQLFVSVFSLMMLTTILGRLCQIGCSNQGGNPELVPLLVFGQGMSIAFSLEAAVITTFIVALSLLLSGSFEITTFLVMLGTITTVVVLSHDIRQRGKTLVAACCGGATAFVLSLATGLFRMQEIQSQLLNDALLRFFWVVLSGFVMSGLLPFIEKIFGILTPMRLLEIGSPSHPLLQELARKAPATYSHSMQLAAISEAAAETIGARGALVRVGAYFHDIGKMMRPDYFTENQNGFNIHDTLEPRMSALIIVAHVKEGVDLARQYGLPEPIIELIEQHHGTLLVLSFYDKANKISRELTGQDLDESSFRYPGPIPQSKEAGILMLADAVESASRSMGDVSPSKIENLVRMITERRVKDGQLDDSGLTLGEIRAVENSMINSILAIKHSRIKYPDPAPEIKTGHHQPPADKLDETVILYKPAIVQNKTALLSNPAEMQDKTVILPKSAVIQDNKDNDAKNSN